MMKGLEQVSTAVTSCKICGGEARLFGVVDFAKSCEELRGKWLPLSGIPVYYRRCQICGFLFTDAFDTWSEADFMANIYNAEYIEVDPEYKEVRPNNNASLVQQFFGARMTELRVLDYGGGSGELCAKLRAAGFSDAQTFDPFVVDFARRPAGTFDLITCFEALEHMPDPMAGIASILSSMKETGLVLFSTLLQDSEFERLGVNWWYVGPRNGHISVFSRGALVSAWQHYGCKTMSFNNNLHVAFRTLPKFAWHLLK